MPERIIDASVAVKWVMKGEPYRKQARSLLHDSLATGISLIAPPLFEYEVESVIQEELLHGYLSVADADRALRALDGAGVQIVTDARIRSRARQIARRFRQRRVYDSVYAALAELRGCDFWTADRAFYEAVKSGLHSVKYLPDYK